ncbi:hypothetical protein VNI00_014375 [Paramarasmius palmivorus]|uniref:F-box domain-containing protein n=1 Tax=Paramarasmius palmivorus TaxID=297713 RepID=A0AAW0BSN8_9AGAR
MPPGTFRGSQAQVDYAMTLPKILENFARGTITSSERSSLNEYLHTAEDDLAQCEVEINKHKGAIMVLEDKRRKIQNFIEKSHSLLAPVHRMPPEILSYIFSFCCQQAVLIPGVQARPPLVSLSFICHRWRDTILSIPSLWSVLDINFEPWKWDFEQLERVVAMYLTRSKSHPLTLYLDLTSTREEDQETSEKCIAILRRIVRESHRWETAELDISPSGLRHPVFQPIMGRLPLLKKLALYGRDNEFDLFNKNIAFNLGSLFGTCPSLEHVLVNDDIASYGSVVPWHQIRTMGLKMFYNVSRGRAPIFGRHRI